MKTILCALCMILSLSMFAQDRTLGKAFATRSEIFAQHGVASTSQPLATQVALDILKQGGNAIDAAIAANAALGLMEPTGCGIGGDLFAIIWIEKTKTLYGLNASGRSPKSLTPDWFLEHDYTSVPEFGPLSVSVPGCVDGWFTMWSRFGTMKMAALLAPAISYSREGYPVTPIVAYYINKTAQRFGRNPGFMGTYLPDGHELKPGDIRKNPALANTLETIARGGRDAFYQGVIAKTIAETVHAQGGFLSEQDLASHISEWVEPVSTNYRGYDVWELPPNGQGIAVLEMLNILEGFNIREMGFGSSDYIHTFVEAKKLAFEDRAKFYADLDFYDAPVDRLISKAYASERRALIQAGVAAKIYPAGDPEHGNTIYMTVADQHGNMVSLIQSNYSGMGSGVIPTGLGFMLQNRGALFTLQKGHANQFEPGKRPFHTIIPGFITKDGDAWVSFGVMGGAMQPQGQTQIVVNLIDFDMNLQEAGDAPRIRHVGSSQPTGEKMTNGGTVYLESGFSYETIRDLMNRGHLIGTGGHFGGYHAILKDTLTGVCFGACESRYDGVAAGY